MRETAEQEFIADIQSLPKFGDGLGLLRVQRVLELLIPTYPQFSFTPIVVTGSNGKGSTSHYIDQLLNAAECRTALFTSPHFLYFNERFRVNGERVAYDELLVTWRLLQKHISQISHELQQQFGRFEVLFLLAVSTFEQYQVQVAIFEAGIGGRYDPVRLLQAPYCVLTSIDLEHRALLGDTHSAICYDKLDACPANATSFISATVPTNLLPQITAYNRLKKVTTVNVASEWRVQLATRNTESHQSTLSAANTDIHVQRYSEEEAHFYHILTAPCAQHLLNPIPQSANLATAIAVATHYVQHHAPALANITRWLQRGLAQLPVAGRMQFIQHNPFPVLIDSAHTPEAFSHLFEALPHIPTGDKLVLVVGQSDDKPAQPLIAGIKQLMKSVSCEVVVTQPSCRGKVAKQLADECRIASMACHIAPTVKQACDTAKALALPSTQSVMTQPNTVVVLGGLFLAAEAQVEFQQLNISLLFE